MSRFTRRRRPDTRPVARRLWRVQGGQGAEAVCSARADIKAQVDELKGMSVTTATLDGVRANLKAIGDSLAKIRTAQRDLTGERKQEAQKATQAFKSEVSASRASSSRASRSPTASSRSRPRWTDVTRSARDQFNSKESHTAFAPPAFLDVLRR